MWIKSFAKTLIFKYQCESIENSIIHTIALFNDIVDVFHRPNIWENKPFSLEHSFSNIYVYREILFFSMTLMCFRFISIGEYNNISVPKLKSHIDSFTFGIGSEILKYSIARTKGLSYSLEFNKFFENNGASEIFEVFNKSPFLQKNDVKDLDEIYPKNLNFYLANSFYKRFYYYLKKTEAASESFFGGNIGRGILVEWLIELAIQKKFQGKLSDEKKGNICKEICHLIDESKFRFRHGSISDLNLIRSTMTFKHFLNCFPEI